MDVKALAKSKRDHTRQHNKKYHGNQKLKVQSQSSFPSSVPNQDDAKEPFAKQQAIEKKTNRSRSQALPGNWDRYEEEDSDSVPESSSKTLDVVVPKSKGADFRHLVAEAQSHADKTLDDFNEVLPWEFGVGLSSILSARGEGIVSWDGDDNFVVQDKTIANQEASLISLNLHAIAQKLAKVDLSKRLFIEPDLLPSELRVEDLAVGSEELEPDEQETAVDHELSKRMSKELNIDDSAADQFTSSSSCSSSHIASISALSDDILVPVNVGKHTTIEAAAELELDMLLDTLDESKSNASFTAPVGVSSKEHPQISIKEPVSTRIASITASLDDALDDLLEETSTLMKPNVLSWPREEKPINPSMLSSQSQNKSKVAADDFDSWFDTL
ncbi:protein ECERIFERUM 16-like [Vicia villosa]|uniref:protein ECERIFERUM 16-like n=1 Tax=Vicia villosa TaxID=3911 RepID=UPI00273B8A5E|nr:protein ECERIFERUM 16-like [Vicia villosa]